MPDSTRGRRSGVAHGARSCHPAPPAGAGGRSPSAVQLHPTPEEDEGEPEHQRHQRHQRQGDGAVRGRLQRPERRGDERDPDPPTLATAAICATAMMPTAVPIPGRQTSTERGGAARPAPRSGPSVDREPADGPVRRRRHRTATRARPPTPRRVEDDRGPGSPPRPRRVERQLGRGHRPGQDRQPKQAGHVRSANSRPVSQLMPTPKAGAPPGRGDPRRHREQRRPVPRRRSGTSLGGGLRVAGTGGGDGRPPAPATPTDQQDPSPRAPGPSGPCRA